MTTYSFMDVQAAITGPGGSFNLGYGSSNSEEGITVTMVEDKNIMVTGADGSPMHSLRAGRSGQFTIHLLKTSPTNALLSQLYNTQTISSALHGKNVITIRNLASDDVITGAQCAFKKLPDITYAKDATMMNWVFDVGISTTVLGSNT